jgi:lantibiotic modifying enzyme
VANTLKSIDFSLSDGLLGYFELDPLIANPFHFSDFKKATQELGSTGHPFLFKGFAGVAFSKEFEKLGADEAGQWLKTFVPTDHVATPELIAGNGGILLALLRTNSRSSTVEDQILTEILSQIKTCSLGMYWLTKPANALNTIAPSKELLNKIDLPLKRLACAVDLGFSHGISGTIFVLSQYIIHRPRSKSRLGPIVSALCKYIIKMRSRSPGGRLTPLSFDHFPMSFGGAYTQAWCYGNPGMSLAVLWGALALNSSYLRQEAMDIFADWNSWRPAKHKIENQFLCHGVAGLAEISRFFFNETGSLEARTAWKNWASKLRKQEVPKSKLQFHKCSGLLNGKLGVIAARRCCELELSGHRWSSFIGTARL